MSSVLSTNLTDASNASLTGPAIATPPRAAAARVKCFHCGEGCKDNGFSKAEKAFCCQGCLVVHDLLTESGLDHFYDLTRHPGVQIRKGAQAGQWEFLDEAAMQQRLLDFTDGAQSRITFHVPAIHCVACVWLLENLFRLHPGIGRSQVNFPKREVAISFATQTLKLSELVALLASIGYEPSLTFDELDKRALSPIQKRQWLQIGIAGFAFGNIMLFSIPQYFGLDSFSGPDLKLLFGWISLTLALPVVTYSALDYWKSAWLSMRQRVATLDVPIVLGLSAIYGQSVYEIASRTGEGYSDSLCGLIFFLLC
ncbi:MAG: heavy metal translocating P-type ATPase, partial [Akkermansiaceae bacterium]|nr:heavy metal translocating P-type ATPase [Verrucomicrobiales bacterium]